MKINYEELIKNAIKKDEVVKLLRGNKEYEVTVSKFTPDVFPTDINAVLVNCFYKQSNVIENIDKIFNKAFNELIEGSASDIYIAVLYFDACIFQEEKGKASFLINKKEISEKLQKKINEVENNLQGSIKFENGMKKSHSWNNIINFNKYYEKKYGVCII